MNSHTKLLRNASNVLNTAKVSAVCVRSLITGNHAYYKGDAKPMATANKVASVASLVLMGTGAALQVKQRVDGKQQPVENESLTMLTDIVLRGILTVTQVKEVATGNAVSFRKANRLPVSQFTRYAVAAQIALNLAIIGTTARELYQRRQELTEALHQVREDLIDALLGDDPSEEEAFNLETRLREQRTDESMNHVKQ